MDLVFGVPRSLISPSGRGYPDRPLTSPSVFTTSTAPLHPGSAHDCCGVVLDHLLLQDGGVASQAHGVAVAGLLVGHVDHDRPGDGESSTTRRRASRHREIRLRHHAPGGRFHAALRRNCSVFLLCKTNVRFIDQLYYEVASIHIQ